MKVKIKIPVRELMVGDKFSATGAVVTHPITRGLCTPPGKCELGVDDYLKTYNANTLVTIERKSK